MIMKAKTLILVILFPLFNLQAQECPGFSRLEKGSKIEMSNYDGKDNLESKNNYEVTDITIEAGKKVWTLHSNSVDAKGKEQFVGDFTLSCENELLKIDIGQALKQILEKFDKPQFDLVTEGAFLEMPTSLSAGQSLPDANVIIKIIDKGSNVEMMTFNILIKNRKVTGKEEITTPAGTFDAYKITDEMETKMDMMGQTKTFGPTLNGIEFFSMDLGTIKREEYANGKLQSYSLLTSFSK